MEILSVRDLSVQHKNSAPVIFKLTFGLKAFAATALVGPNGSGKTTFLGVLAGLVPAYEGEIRFYGMPWNAEALRKTAFVFEHPWFPPLMKAKGVLRFFASLYGLANAWRRSGELVELCGLEQVDLRFFQYSLGMRQRLGFAVALLKGPELLLVDDGLSAVDETNRRRIFTHLRAEIASNRLSVLFATRSGEDCRDLAASILPLKTIQEKN